MIKVQNQIKYRGSEILDHVLLTSGLEWQSVTFCLQKRDDILHYSSNQHVVVPEPDEKMEECSKEVLSAEEFDSALIVMGVQQQLRSSFLENAFNELYEFCKENGIPWEGHHLVVRHSGEETHMGAPVELILRNKSNSENIEQWMDQEVYNIPMSPRFSLINADFLRRVLHCASNADYHAKKVNSLLAKKLHNSVNLEKCVVRLFDSDTDASPLLIPFQVIGSFSTQYSTWCWAWYNLSYMPTQYSEITRLRNKSEQEGWPERNLFCCPVVDCEAAFCFTISHLIVARMGNPNVFVYSIVPQDNGPRIFLALQDPEHLT